MRMRYPSHPLRTLPRPEAAPVPPKKALYRECVKERFFQAFHHKEGCPQGCSQHRRHSPGGTAEELFPEEILLRRGGGVERCPHIGGRPHDSPASSGGQGYHGTHSLEKPGKGGKRLFPRVVAPQTFHAVPRHSRKEALFQKAAQEKPPRKKEKSAPGNPFHCGLPHTDKPYKRETPPPTRTPSKARRRISPAPRKRGSFSRKKGSSPSFKACSFCITRHPSMPRGPCEAAPFISSLSSRSSAGRGYFS